MAAMNMNQEQFKQLIREEKPVLVDFWAPWCSYCRRIGPAYEKIGEEYGTERPWIPSSRPAQRQKSTVSFRKPWRNNGGFRYEQQSCL